MPLNYSFSGSRLLDIVNCRALASTVPIQSWAALGGSENTRQGYVHFGFRARATADTPAREATGATATVPAAGVPGNSGDASRPGWEQKPQKHAYGR